jgi:hypothetical protein
VFLGVPTLRENEGWWRAAHGVAYGGLGVILLGALARIVPASGPNVWRAATLGIGAGFAALGVWVTLRWLPTAAFDAWMAALLGLAVAVMLPRWLPDVLTRRWLAIERRHDAVYD